MTRSIAFVGLSCPTCLVKELVDNALDADATSISITFREYGLDSIEVQDNGRGIREQDWPSIALKHHTSKLSSFDDLTSVATLGFRGEALSSLCAVARLSMTTATAETAPVGAVLAFDSSGKSTPMGRIARTIGTTATVQELFKTMPVRRKELQKNIKREFAKALELLQAYALFRSGVRFEVKNNVKGKMSTQLQTPPNSSLRSNFSALFSAKALASTVSLSIEFDVRPDKSLQKLANSHEPIRVAVEGLMSKAELNCGKAAGNRQYFALNGRPFLPTKIPRVFNEVYRAVIPNTFPMLAVDFTIAADSYDVNVSPDKRTIYLHSENNLLTALRVRSQLFVWLAVAEDGNLQLALETWLHESHGTYVPAIDATGKAQVPGHRSASPGLPAGPSGDDLLEAPAARKRRRVESSDIGTEDMHAERTPFLPSPRDRDNELAGSDDEGDQPSPTKTFLPKRPSAQIYGSFELNHSIPATKSRAPSSANPETNQPSLRQFLRPADSDADAVVADVEVEVRDDLQATRLQSQTRASRCEGGEMSGSTSTGSLLTSSRPPGSPSDVGEDRSLSDTAGAGALSSYAIVEDENLDVEILTESLPLTSADEEEATSGGFAIQVSDSIVATRMSDICASWTERRAGRDDPSEPIGAATSNSMEDAGLNGATLDAEDALSRNVSKQDFLGMQIVGQFNYAFIITRRRQAKQGAGLANDDLFIVDQHASDEKFNFEDLQTNTVMQSQQLLQSQILHLPAHDELTAIENADVLRLNGFGVQIDEEAQVGHRIKLVAKPVSKDTVFGLDDLEELLEQISSRSKSTVARTSKARRMFASRACRKSVMFGKALTQSQMRTILTHMSEMHQPWHCPHGRPTMRWLHALGATRERINLHDEIIAQMAND
ncbi:ATP-binding mismatch repair protein [Microbotryomycetes sp. JL201]|nr:ATP-binding mismatch repair protein [Microbotryomycetes sp. JL201]